jgi:hypothetical protein
VLLLRIQCPTPRLLFTGRPAFSRGNTNLTNVLQKYMKYGLDNSRFQWTGPVEVLTSNVE